LLIAPISQLSHAQGGKVGNTLSHCFSLTFDPNVTEVRACVRVFASIAAVERSLVVEFTFSRSFLGTQQPHRR